MQAAAHTFVYMDRKTSVYYALHFTRAVYCDHCDVQVYSCNPVSLTSSSARQDQVTHHRAHRTCMLLDPGHRSHLILAGT